MMHDNSPQTRLTDRKRAAILDAAVRQFRAAGFDNTSMDRIADAANVSKRTVYNHFPSKELLFAAIVERIRSRCDNASKVAYSKDLSLESQLQEIGDAYVEMLSSDDLRDLARVILPRFLQSPQLAHQLQGDLRPGELGLIEWIKTAQRSGALQEADPVVAARQFQGLISTFAFWPQITSGDPPLTTAEQASIVRKAVAMFLDNYRN